MSLLKFFLIIWVKLNIHLQKKNIYLKNSKCLWEGTENSVNQVKGDKIYKNKIENSIAFVINKYNYIINKICNNYIF